MVGLQKVNSLKNVEFIGSQKERELIARTMSMCKNDRTDYITCYTIHEYNFVLFGQTM